MTTSELPQLSLERPSLLDRHPLRLELQAKAPICRVRTPAGDEGWLVTRYAEVKALVADHRLMRTVPDVATAPRLVDNPMLNLLVSDGDLEGELEEHARKRVLFLPSLSARRVLEQRENLEELAASFVDPIVGKGSPADLHTEFTRRYSERGLAMMIGVHPDYLDELLLRMDRVGNVRNLEDARAGMESLFTLATEISARRRKEPGADVLSRFIDAGLPDDENGKHAISLMFGGLNGTSSHVFLGIVLLLMHPDQRKLAMSDPELMASAADEVLRVAPGTPVLPRYAQERIEMGGVTMERGDLIILDFSLANVDPRVYDHPERFDVTRSPNPQLSFGYGMRHCMGAPLARTMMQVAYTTLFSRLPGLRLAVSPEELEENSTGRLAGGLAALPVEW